MNIIYIHIISRSVVTPVPCYNPHSRRVGTHRNPWQVFCSLPAVDAWRKARLDGSHCFFKGGISLS